MTSLRMLSAEPTAENAEAFYTFQPWNENPYGWGAPFMFDSELNWMSGKTPVEDL